MAGVAPEGSQLDAMELPKNHLRETISEFDSGMEMSDHQQQQQREMDIEQALTEPQNIEYDLEMRETGIMDMSASCDIQMRRDWGMGKNSGMEMGVHQLQREKDIEQALTKPQNIGYGLEIMMESLSCDMKMRRDWGMGIIRRIRKVRQQFDGFIRPQYNHRIVKLQQDAYLSMMNGGSAHRMMRTHDHENVTITQEMKSPMGNTGLHIAAMYGKGEWVEKTVEQAQSLLIAQNNNGDTPLHLAARTGHIPILKRLFTAHLNSSQFSYSNETLLVKNNQGNTFFHEALYNGHGGVLSLLFSDDKLGIDAGLKDLVDRIAITQTNNESKSVLYLAVEAGYKEFVGQALLKLYKEFVGQTFDQALFLKGDVVSGKSPLHAAILKEDQGIFEDIVDKMPEWIQLKDNEGRTPLHHAASIGYLHAVTFLLRKGVCDSVRDKDGFFPIHLASDGGHVEVVKVLLKFGCCPYPREMLDNCGRNILHLAIQNGKLNVVRYILKASNSNKELEEMINDKDADGNTPLHMASLRCYPKIVHVLTWDKRVNRTLVNNMHHTALDVCMQFPLENTSLRQRLTWIALKSARVPFTTKVPSQSIESHWKQEPQKMDNYKDRVNTLLLVSTLIITATFAAGFAMPGGINSDDPGKGMSLLLHRMWFKLFIFCITISLYGAITATIILIWAHLGDIMARLSLQLAKPILGITLTIMSIAFLAGVHLVISDLSWLATITLVMSVIFILTLYLLYYLLLLPSSSSITIVRYLSYFPFLFLASLVEKDETSGNHKHLDSSRSVSLRRAPIPPGDKEDELKKIICTS